MVLAATDCHLEDNLRVAAVKAHLVGISRLGGAVGSLDMEALAFKRVQLTGVTFRTRAIHEKVDVVRALRTTSTWTRPPPSSVPWWIPSPLGTGLSSCRRGWRPATTWARWSWKYPRRPHEPCAVDGGPLDRRQLTTSVRRNRCVQP
jgi:hypothetical protein